MSRDDRPERARPEVDDETLEALLIIAASSVDPERRAAARQLLDQARRSDWRPSALETAQARELIEVEIEAGDHGSGGASRA